MPTANNGRGGRGATFPFGANVTDISLDAVKRQQFDAILYQHRDNWEIDRELILSREQRNNLPQIYLEHDPPLINPVDELHPAATEENVLLVHCTAFNALMWNNGAAETRVVEHGVFLMTEASARYQKPAGVCAVNNIATRGRRAGREFLDFARAHDINIDLVGMNAEEARGLGEVAPPDLPAFFADYRFYFNPSLYTSLNLAMIEAMLVGLPVVALRTTEAATVIENNINGFADTNPQRLIEPLRELIKNPKLAREMGARARRYALERFGIERFTREWNKVFAIAAGKTQTGFTAATAAGKILAANNLA